MSELRAVTLTQPWATAAARGEKSVETRGWRPGYRGVLAIHAAKTYPASARLAYEDGTRTLLAPSRLRDLPLGAVVGVCSLYECLRVEDVRGLLSAHELRWGDYSDGRYAWLLHEAFELPEPVPCSGALGLWRLPQDAAERVLSQLSEPLVSA